MLKGVVVGFSVFLHEIAPVAGLVAHEKELRRNLSFIASMQRTWGSYCSSEREARSPFVFVFASGKAFGHMRESLSNRWWDFNRIRSS